MIGDKGAIRRDLRARRRGVPSEAVAAAAAAVADRLLAFGPYLCARTLAAYVAAENEIPVEEVVGDAWRAGRTVLLPHQGCMAFVPWHPGEPLVPGRAGILEPRVGTGVLPAPPALVLVPLVAWDRSGCRLGRGGGFYDRVLGSLGSGVTRVGVGFEFQEHPGLPAEPWDVPVHYVITERRVVTCAAREADRQASRIQEGGLSPTWVRSS